MKITKRQLRRIIREAFDELPENMDAEGRTIPPVSYTHLTLPTRCLV